MTDPKVENDPVRDLLRQAMAFHQNGRLAEADDLYTQVLRSEGTNPQALRLRGILARQRGDILDSLEDLKAALEAAPDDADALCELGLSYMDAGELTPAVAALRDAVDADPESPKALANLGALLQYRGHIEEAIAAYRRFLALEPGDMDVRCNLAKALVEAGRGDEAVAESKRTVRQSGSHPTAVANMGNVLCDMERFDEAVEILERAVAADPGDDVALINLSVARLSLGRIDGAVEALQASVAANPHNARGVADLANLLSVTGEASRALSMCETFLAQHPGERMVVASYAYGLINAGREDAAAALLDFDRFINIDDLGAPEGYNSMGDFNRRLAAILSEHPSLLTDPLSKATYGGSQTGELDFDDDETLTAFETMIDAAIVKAAAQFRAAGAVRHSLLADPPAAWTLRAWGTLLRDGGHQIPHMHPLGWLSGIYYVRLPKDMSKGASHAGWIEFGSPPSRYRVTGRITRRTVEPKPGRLVLFPSYFYHRTMPFASAEPRLSIAFDVMPTRLLKPERALRFDPAF